MVIAPSIKVSHGMTRVLFQDAINCRVESKRRATVNSLNSLAFRLGITLVGLTIGCSLDKWGMTGTVTTLTIDFLALFFIFTLPLIKKPSLWPETEFRARDVSRAQRGIS